MTPQAEPLPLGDEGSRRHALRDLRAARRSRYADQLDWVDTLYRVYLLAIFGAVGVAMVSGVLGDARAVPPTVGDIRGHGPALLGLLLALAVAGGLRAGGRGGPLAIQAADVQHVLLAPVDRGAALRWLALRQLRSAALVGVIAGAVIGNLAFRRLPGRPADWIASAAIFFALLPLSALGAAFVASGRRLRPLYTNLLGPLVVGWSLLDILAGAETSPQTMLGRIGLWPLHPGGGSALLPGAALVGLVVLLVVALRDIAGTSIEAARRRADLAAELRFAVTLADLRTVVLLRRQLASERARPRPWLRLGSPSTGVSPVFRRALQSFLRWPAVRVGRIVALGVVVGLALCGAWQGTTPLAIVAAIGLLVAGLDCVEPFAQELDHPVRRDLLPVDPGRLMRRHLIAPTALMTGVCLAAVAAGLSVGSPGLVLGVGLVMAAPTALMVLCAAAMSASNDPYAFLLIPWLGYILAAVPLLLSAYAVAPAIAAREAARHGHSAVGTAVVAEVQMLLVAFGLVWWLGFRIKRRLAVKP
jgi:hypothetical protein